MDKITKKCKRKECLPKLGSLGRKGVSEGKLHQEVVVEVVRDKEEDVEFIRDKSLVHEPSDASKNKSLREEEAIAFYERLTVIKIQKHENSDEKLKVEEGVDVYKQALPKFGAWGSIQNSEDPKDIFEACREKRPRRGDMIDEFSKVKTFDLRGVSNSSDKGEVTKSNSLVSTFSLK